MTGEAPNNFLAGAFGIVVRFAKCQGDCGRKHCYLLGLWWAYLPQISNTMTVPRQKFRELIFQLLYSREVSDASDEAMVPLMMKELAISRKTVRQAQEHVRDIIAHQDAIDVRIASASQSYAFERIQVIERNILRLGAYELFYDDEVPAKVAIAEAIRLARKFGTPEAAAFVNALLDHLYKESTGEAADDPQLAQTIEALVESEELTKEAAAGQESSSDDEDDAASENDGDGG